MNLNLVSTKHGLYDFDITNAGITISRAAVPQTIEYKELFNIYYGDGHYIPNRKEGGVWRGREGVKGDLLGTLERSIRRSQCFIGESIDSDEFYKNMAKRFCQCSCSEPGFVRGAKSCVIGADLDYADYGRSSSRHIVLLGTCNRCKKDMTQAAGIGSYHTTGLEKLKSIVEKDTGAVIDWSSVITSINAI